MLRRTLLRCIGAVLALTTADAHSLFQLWKIAELYSNADGSIQFLELATPFSQQQFLVLRTLTATGANGTNTFVFPEDLPGDTFARTFLVATEGFAALKRVKPDYVVPNGFFPLQGGTIDFAGADVWEYGPLPVDGHRSLDRNGGWSPATPINFSGETATAGFE